MSESGDQPARDPRRAPSPEEYERFVPRSASDKLKDTSGGSNFQYGVVLGGLVLGGMYYNFKKKGTKYTLPVYLIHTRLAVQSTVIGCLIAAMGYQMYTRLRKTDVVEK